jgi:hypothetical protein
VVVVPAGQGSVSTKGSHALSHTDPPSPVAAKELPKKAEEVLEEDSKMD